MMGGLSAKLHAGPEASTIGGPDEPGAPNISSGGTLLFTVPTQY